MIGSSTYYTNRTTTSTGTSSVENENRDTNDDIYPDLRLLLLDQENSSRTGNYHHTIYIYIACSRKGVRFANCKLSQ